MSEYHTLEVLHMNARRFLDLIGAATKRRNERDLFFRWVVERYSTQIPFDEFVELMKPQRKKTAEEILDDTKNIMETATWQVHSLS